MSPDSDFFDDPFGGTGQLVTEGINKRCWVANVEGKLMQCVVERIDPILEENLRTRNDTAGQRFGDTRLVARIPNSMFWHGDFAKARDADDQRWMARFLNDRDNLKLRAFEGDV